MKNIVFMFLLLGTLLNANSEYNLKYKLFNDGEEIGTLEALCIKNSEGIYKYSTRLDVEFSYLFMKYSYLFVEDAYVQDENIVSLFVYEKDNDEVKKAKAIKDGEYLVYEDGTKVKLSQIDYLPFDFMPKIDENRLSQKEFVLKTFDSLSGELFSEKNQITKEQNGKYYMDTIAQEDSKGKKIISKDGTLEYMKNEYFEAKLIR